MGKTVQAIATLNERDYESVLVVCPASLKLNWKREFLKWGGEPPYITIINDGKQELNLLRAGVFIINYDLLCKYPQVLTHDWNYVVMDECHYLKNPKAKRTKCALKLKGQIIALTGTLIMNRPIEAFPILNRIAPAMFPNWWKFAKEFCDMKETRFGLDVRGASNLPRLKALLDRVMIRRLKKDVLPQLPAKRRQIIELPPTKEMRSVLNRENMQWGLHEDTLQRLVARRDAAKINDEEEEYRTAARELRDAYNVAFSEMARIRKETALAKLPLCIQHCRDVLEGGVAKVVIFAHHKECVANVLEELKEYHPVHLVGDDSLEERQKAVDAFQNDPEARVFVGDRKSVV